MKRTVMIWLALVLAIMGAGADGRVGAQDEDVIYGLIDVDAADVRVGPDFAYAVIGQLPRNASVIVLGRSGDFYSRWDGRQWLQIEYGASPAWVYARLVRTSTAFNSIPPTGRLLPRDGNGRVPQGFDLSSYVCDQWVGSFTQTGNFMAGDTEMTVTYPYLQGANLYSVIVIRSDGYRVAFDSETTTAVIELDKLPREAGIYTWRVAPYWTNSTYRYSWQQVCLLQTGGTFEKPYTGS
ncbi:MAG: SH3 domain-containing protein [Anaerolineae bacterium]|nr:SH3 domain-containing protein [Anaerolineae bacterium]